MINGGIENNESSVMVTNSIGQKLFAMNLKRHSTVVETPLKTGVYLVTVTNSGKSVTQKVIIK